MKGPRRHRAARRSARPTGKSSNSSGPPTKRSDRSGEPVEVKFSKSRRASKVATSPIRVGVIDNEEGSFAIFHHQGELVSQVPKRDVQ